MDSGDDDDVFCPPLPPMGVPRLFGVPASDLPDSSKMSVYIRWGRLEHVYLVLHGKCTGAKLSDIQQADAVICAFVAGQTDLAEDMVRYHRYGCTPALFVRIWVETSKYEIEYGDDILAVVATEILAPKLLRSYPRLRAELAPLLDSFARLVGDYDLDEPALKTATDIVRHILSTGGKIKDPRKFADVLLRPPIGGVTDPELKLANAWRQSRSPPTFLYPLLVLVSYAGNCECLNIPLRDVLSHPSRENKVQFRGESHSHTCHHLYHRVLDSSPSSRMSVAATEPAAEVFGIRLRPGDVYTSWINTTAELLQYYWRSVDSGSALSFQYSAIAPDDDPDGKVDRCLSAMIDRLAGYRREALSAAIESVKSIMSLNETWYTEWLRHIAWLRQSSSPADYAKWSSSVDVGKLPQLIVGRFCAKASGCMGDLVQAVEVVGKRIQAVIADYLEPAFVDRVYPRPCEVSGIL